MLLIEALQDLYFGSVPKVAQLQIGHELMRQLLEQTSSKAAMVIDREVPIVTHPKMSPSLPQISPLPYSRSVRVLSDNTPQIERERARTLCLELKTFF
jgi:hypothetical protein